jgi:type II secretory pathway pseudopilin PulG
MPVGKAARQRLRLGSERGFTYAAVLVAMLVLALATQGVMTFVSQQVQRERESDLLRIGQLYASAIGAFYEASPGNVKSWPTSFEDLIEDKRFVSVRRHLREVYPDPMTKSRNWGLIVAADGGIAGVHSHSMAAPIRSIPVDLGLGPIPNVARYADWQFVYRPPLPASLATPIR